MHIRQRERERWQKWALGGWKMGTKLFRVSERERESSNIGYVESLCKIYMYQYHQLFIDGLKHAHRGALYHKVVAVEVVV